MNEKDDDNIGELIDAMQSGYDNYHYKQAVALIQHVLHEKDRLSVDDKILQMKIVHSHMQHVHETQRRKDLALALAKYAVYDNDAILQVSVFYPVKEGK